MTLNELQNKINGIKRGRFFKLNYATTKNGLTKKTSMVARIVKYSHINGVVVKGQTNTNEQHLNDCIIYNSNTQKYYLQFATTKVKSHSTYYNGETEISKADYELINKPRNGEKPVVMKIGIENIVSIG